MPPLTVRSLLQEGSRQLSSATDSPYLDAVLLLSSVLGLSREKLLASYPESVTSADAEAFQALLNRRLAGEPAAYLLGVREFWGLPFRVDSRVLTPRPDTETLVEAALSLLSPENEETQTVKRVHEVGTGSGCIAIALKHENPRLEVSGSDISAEALAVARRNAEELLPADSPLPLVQADLLQDLPLPGPWDLIVSNPPYLTSAEIEEKKAQGWPEPLLALDGGDDGLDLIRTLISQAKNRLVPGGHLLLEADPRQMESLGSLLRSRGWEDVTLYPDLTGRNRIAGARRPDAPGDGTRTEGSRRCRK